MANKTIVKFKNLGKKTLEKDKMHVDLMLEQDWSLAPHVFTMDRSRKDLPPIHCQVSEREYMKHSRSLVPGLKTGTGTPKKIYAERSKERWFVMDVTDINGKKHKSIAGWTRTSVGVPWDGKEIEASVVISRPSAMRRIPDTVDHEEIRVSKQEFLDVEATLKHYAGTLPNDNPEIV